MTLTEESLEEVTDWVDCIHCQADGCTRPVQFAVRFERACSCLNKRGRAFLCRRHGSRNGLWQCNMCMTRLAWCEVIPY